MRRIVAAGLGVALAAATAVAQDVPTTQAGTTDEHRVQFADWKAAQERVTEAVRRGDLEAALSATDAVWKSQPDAFGPRGRSAAPAKFGLLLRFHQQDRALAMGDELVAWFGDYPSYAGEQATIVRETLGERGRLLAARLDRLADPNGHGATQPATTRATTRG